ncbi:MAG: AMMECR1 domain-containing protein, partial [Pseudomonadota bacterium]
KPKSVSFADRAALVAGLRIGVDGLIIADGAHRALFLPSVWESLPNAEIFLAHLCKKAGLPSTHWSSSMQTQIFHADKTVPQPFPKLARNG